ncbi:hypothetical protein KC363_g5682 [Hortaea werneckii]|nr:hypothetical protein KC361_g5665 [Hortaea werneckii]KAI6882653.1 hypothetical protein KC325_g5642 [Hortaea werneckii]KAI6992168.1 hypothetical protein KC359_g5841 [Hortaea werneckii]KAI7082401.1 hypothetical protein KC356_g8403 [Hortaea werneckii]KAI7172658.1 hypothetical protein KC360_g5355 [Hortaea werneckii]
MGLLQPLYRENEPISECVNGNVWGFVTPRQTTDFEISAYVRAFSFSKAQNYDPEDDRITNAFLSAAYLALEAWMDHPDHTSNSYITFDLGEDTDIPVISKTGVVLISVLLGLDLTCLLGLAIYSSLTPTWTNQFDAFAMMRLGAAMHEELPLNVSHSQRQVKALDTMSGFVGDGPEETSNGVIRQLTLGASTPIEGGKEYRCYKSLSFKQRFLTGFVWY